MASDLCLVQYNGAPKQKMTAQEKVDFAKQIGIGFFRIHHKDEFGKGHRTTHGFQPVQVTYREDRGKRKITKEGMQDRFGRPITANAWYHPDQMGLLWADIPDTERNRQILAGSLYNGAWWILGDKTDPSGYGSATDADKKLFAEIQALAETMGVKKVEEKPRVVVLSEEVERLKAANAALQDRLTTVESAEKAAGVVAQTLRGRPKNGNND